MIVGVETNGRAKLLGRHLRTVERDQRFPVSAVRVGVVRSKSEGLAVGLRRFLLSTQKGGRFGEREQRFWPLRRHGVGALVKGGRRGDIATGTGGVGDSKDLGDSTVAVVGCPLRTGRHRTRAAGHDGKKWNDDGDRKRGPQSRDAVRLHRLQHAFPPRFIQARRPWTCAPLFRFCATEIPATQKIGCIFPSIAILWRFRQDVQAKDVAGENEREKEYLELTRLIERLHRRFLDLLRAELNRLGIWDINSVQALLLANIGDEEIAIRDLVERGYYQGSNVSYNIKKLAEMGYLEQERSAHDRRSVSIRLTDKALKVVGEIRQLEQRIAAQPDDQAVSPTGTESVCQALRRVKRTWTDYVHYGRK